MQVALDTITQQSPNEPQVGPFDGQRAARLRCRTSRIEARNALAVAKCEADMLKRIADDSWIAYVQQQSRTCHDLRARATWAKLVAEIARLGKREPVNNAATGPQQITINVIHAAPVRREDVLAEFGIVEPVSQTIDIEPEAPDPNSPPQIGST